MSIRTTKYLLLKKMCAVRKLKIYPRTPYTVDMTVGYDVNLNMVGYSRDIKKVDCVALQKDKILISRVAYRSYIINYI